MVTFFQLTKKKLRVYRKKQCLTKALKHCPQRKGSCAEVLIKTPKKPCSARRKVMKVYLSTKKYILAYIPGEGHNLMRFSRVLIRGGSRPDLPGVHYIIIRGKCDLHPLLLKRQGRSKYGQKLQNRPRKKDRRNSFKKKK